MEAKIYPWGAEHKTLMRRSPMRDRLWAFTMQGEDLPQPTNRVDLDPTVRDVRGFPVARDHVPAPTATSSPPRPTTAPATYACSRTWAPRGR